MNRILVHPALHQTVDAMRKVGVRLPPEAENPVAVLESQMGPTGVKVSRIEAGGPVAVDANAGRVVFDSGLPIFAYDESIQKYSALEGMAYFTAHSLVTPTERQYLSVVFLTSYFYTRSKSLGEKDPRLQYTEDAGQASQKDYIEDRIALLRENVPDGALLFIDGPIIAGDVYTRFLTFLDELQQRDVIPIFVVKNSESSLVLDAVPEWRKQYNSDLHWAHRNLQRGQRSSMFMYEDLHNPRNSKVFAYLKTFEDSPLRVEFHTSTAKKYGSRLPALFDLAYFLVIAQGRPANPQPRPVAVAEMFARETLKVLDVQTLMRKANLVPTINQVRFGG